VPVPDYARIMPAIIYASHMPIAMWLVHGYYAP